MALSLSLPLPLSLSSPLPLSAGQMTDLIHTEKELVQSLKEYIQAEESKLAAVKRSEVATSHHSNVASILENKFAKLRKPQVEMIQN